MSIQLLARDLYRLINEIEALEKKIETTAHEKQKGLKDDLRKLTAERNLIRKALDGTKDSK